MTTRYQCNLPHIVPLSPVPCSSLVMSSIYRTWCEYAVLYFVLVPLNVLERRQSRCRYNSLQNWGSYLFHKFPSTPDLALWSCMLSRLAAPAALFGSRLYSFIPENNEVPLLLWPTSPEPLLSFWWASAVDRAPVSFKPDMLSELVLCLVMGSEDRCGVECNSTSNEDRIPYGCLYTTTSMLQTGIFMIKKHLERPGRHAVLRSRPLTDPRSTSFGSSTDRVCMIGC